MKINVIKIIFLFVIIGNSNAQEQLQIDFNQIKLKIEKKNSKTYYPELLKRFNDFDATLTLEENTLIYYGFSFQNDYIKNKPKEQDLEIFLEKKEYEKLIDECLKILKDNPVSLEANNKMGYALYKLGYPESEWKKYQKRYRDIRKVISLSGNGLSCETAFKVIYVSDMYNMIYDYFEITKVTRQPLDGFCDRFINEESEYYNAKEIYFDISRSLIRHEEIINKK